MTSEPVPVRTLLGAKGFDTSLICLRSLVDYSADPVRLIVHEDGTLADEHRDKLRAIFPGAEFVDRRSADEAVYDELSKHPRCLNFRRSEILALKLFDIALPSAGPVAYCDSDVLFLRRYSGLFHPPSPETPVFMADVGHAYAVRPWRLYPLGKLRLVGRLNTGFILAPAGYLDLDFLEWLLGVLAADPVFAKRRYWTEQTCWAALASRSPTVLLDRCRVVIASPRMNGYTNDTVAIHFVATYRAKLKDYLAKQRNPAEPAANVEVFRPRRVSGLGMFWSDLRRRLILGG